MRPGADANVPAARPNRQRLRWSMAGAIGGLLLAGLVALTAAHSVSSADRAPNQASVSATATATDQQAAAQDMDMRMHEQDYCQCGK